MDTIHIIIVDDHPAVRLGLEAILNKFNDIAVIGVADSGQHALALCHREVPDVALVDMFMPHMDGIQTIQAMHQEFPQIRILVLTQSDRDETVVKAMDAGAMGYLVKDAEINAIADAIRAASQGKRTLSPGALEAIIRSKTAPQPHPDNQLTDREREVLHLMVKGLKNPQIAKELFVSLSTVKFHISMIFKKLEVTTRTEAVVKAIDSGIVDRPEE